MKNHIRFGFVSLLLCAGGGAWAAEINQGGGSGAGVETPAPAGQAPYTGIDATHDGYYAYAGLVFAPSKDMTQSGVLVNLIGGHGRFQYPSDEAGDGIAEGTVVMLDALAGYQWVGERGRIATLVGIGTTDISLPAFDSDSENHGRDTGAKISFDGETNSSIRPYFGASASYSMSFDSWTVRVRPGYRADQYVFGAELSAQGNQAGDVHRVGLFSNYEQPAGKWGTFSVSASGGWGYVEEDDSTNFIGGNQNGPYGAMTLSLFF